MTSMLFYSPKHILRCRYVSHDLYAIILIDLYISAYLLYVIYSFYFCSKLSKKRIKRFPNYVILKNKSIEALLYDVHIFLIKPIIIKKIYRMI